MLSRLASRGSYGWLFAVGLSAGIAMATLLGASRTAPVQHRSCGIVSITPVVNCDARDEAARATAVIHFFDNEVRYATAEDPMAAKAAALLALPMPCGVSQYSYPALSRHIESTATIAIQRGDTQTARRLLDLGRAYNVDGRMLDTLASRL